MADWKIEGQYMETCNCLFVCPCATSNFTATPTEGDCRVAIAMRIDSGHKDGVDLDGLCFIVLMHSPQAMMDGNITVGLIIDDKADEAQTQAIADIASGAVGGPMAELAPLVGEMAGIERRPIHFKSDGLTYSVEAGDLLSQTCEGVESGSSPGEPMYLDNAFHPVTTRLALAKATQSSFHAFGIDWDDTSGTRQGHFAPFSWTG